MNGILIVAIMIVDHTEWYRSNWSDKKEKYLIIPIQTVYFHVRAMAQMKGADEIKVLDRFGICRQ